MTDPAPNLSSWLAENLLGWKRIEPFASDPKDDVWHAPDLSTPPQHANSLTTTYEGMGLVIEATLAREFMCPACRLPRTPVVNMHIGPTGTLALIRCHECMAVIGRAEGKDTKQAVALAARGPAAGGVGRHQEVDAVGQARLQAS